MKAIVQGETHISRADRNDLLDHISDETDCIFMEGGKAEITRSKLTPGYAFFLIGMITYLGFLRSLRKCRMPPLEEEASEYGTDFHGNIDMNVIDMYSDATKLWGLFFVILIIVMAILARNTLDAFFIGFLVAIAPLGYFGFLMFPEKTMEGRDQAMASNIRKIAEENGYDEIIVSCGQKHVDGISNILDDYRGWNVKKNPRNFMGWSRIHLLNPLLWGSWIYSIIRCVSTHVQNLTADFWNEEEINTL